MATPNPADVLGTSDEIHRRNAIIRRAIRSLPPGEQAAVSLFYVGGCSHRDVAEYLGIRIPAVKSRLHSARSRLRERIRQMTEATDQEQFYADETIADLTDAEREEALRGIEACYRRYEDGYELQNPEIVLPTMTDDYLVIFPAAMNHPAWDKVRVEAEVHKCGLQPRGGPRLKVLIDHLLSVERDPIIGAVNQVTLRVTLLREGHKGDNSPFGRIDTLKREGDTWRLRRTLGLGPEKS